MLNRLDRVEPVLTRGWHRTELTEADRNGMEAYVRQAGLTAELDLRAGPATVSLARAAVRELLERHGVTGGDYADRVELVTAEIVTNAVRHVGGRVFVDMSADDGGMIIAASDTGVDPPVASGADDESGRGLLIVAALSAAWGSHDVPGGKRVWARVSP